MTAPDDVSAGRITFGDAYTSALLDGDYDIVVGHRIAASGNRAFDDLYATSRRLRVEGPRFTLGPGEVAAQFPPAGSTGEYEGVLPHVVLRRKTLPWERTADPDGGNEGVPWLALLVFWDDDSPPGRPPPWEPQAGRPEALVPGPGVATYGSLPPPATGGPAFATIDVPAQLWHRIAPAYDDLRWLAHGREVSGPGSAPSDQSVVVANRLPRRGGRSTVQLVSLEGLGRLLPGSDQEPTSGAVRLVSLASWTFASLDPEHTFTRRLQAIDVGPLTAPLPPDMAAGAPRLVTEAAALGYVPLTHRTASGDRTVSWYRGPFLPYRDDPVLDESLVPLAEPVDTPDRLLRVDPLTGMLDVSYAAAFQLGQLLVLHDSAVANELTGWKHDNLRRSAAALEREILRERLGGVLDLSDGEGAVDAGSLRRAAAQVLGGVDTGAVSPRTAAEAAPGSGAYHRAEHADSFVALGSDPASWRALGALTPVPAGVTRWLGRLRLLAGVPTAYLLADPSLVPAESLRCFELDWNWVAALVQGALSVGRSSPALAAHDAAVHEDARLVPPGPVAGILLRTAVLRDWPEVIVQARDASGLPLDGLRTERLAPDLLLHLAAGRMETVVVSEPAAGLHFGLTVQEVPGGRQLTKGLRRPDGRARTPREGIAAVEVPFRPGGDEVLDVAALADSIRTALGVERLGVGDLAMQMVEGVQAVEFAIGSAP